MLENDGAISVNPIQNAPVKPPIPELVDAINCVFTFDNTVERLEFYRQYSNVAQFAIEVKKISFYNYLNGKYGFKFQGKPGINHYVYAFDKAGHRSAKLEFYVMTDEEKAKELETYYEETKTISNTLADKEREIGTEINAMNVSPESRKRILVQESKTPDIMILTAPVVLEVSKDEVTLDVSYKDSTEQLVTDFYAAIAPVGDALYKRSVYKKKITSNTIEFTTSYGGVRPDMQYAVWIENSMGQQISPCVTFATHLVIDTTTEDDEEKINLRDNNEMISQITSGLGSKITVTNEITSCINNLKEDFTITWKNVFDKIVQNLMNYTPKISNVDSTVRALYEVQADILHRVYLGFFPDVVFDPKAFTLKFGPRLEDYMVTAYYVDVNSSSFKTYKAAVGQDNIITLDKTSKYVVVYGVGSDVYTKSGTIVID
jgi:hypothetical protein